MRRRPAIVVPIVLYGVLAVLVVPVFPHAPSPNELSRWAIDVAVADFHTIEISRVIALGIPIGDIASKDGRTYSNKVPGSSLVVLPAYVVARAVIGAPSPSTVRATLNALRIFGATIPTILLAIWFVSAARRLGIADDRVAVGVAAMLFGTVVFTYGLLFFSHALSAIGVFGAWALLFIGRKTEHRGPGTEDYAAGALIGLAVLTESSPVFAGAVLILCALPVIGIKGALRVVAGGIPFALAFFAYNTIAFGGPLALPFYFDTSAHIRDIDNAGFLGLQWPVFTADILLDSGKGLLILSPVVLMAVAGLGRARRALSMPAFLALILVPLAILAPIAGYPYWFGGRCVGVRYIEPMMPFLALLIAFAADTAIEVLLLGASAATIAILSLVFPFVPTIYAVPWVSFAWPLLRDGCVVPNLLHFVSRPLAIVVPFALVAIAVAFAVPKRRIVWMVAGGALWFAIGLVAEARHPSPQFLRVLIEEVHFQRDGLIARTYPPGPQRAALERTAAGLKRLPPPEWPF